MEEELIVREIFDRHDEIQTWQIEKCLVEGTCRFSCLGYRTLLLYLKAVLPSELITMTTKVYLTRSLYDTFQISLRSQFPRLRPGVVSTLYPHQIDALKWMIEQENHPPLIGGVPVSGGILADAMGLGKTKTFIALITVQPPSRTLLVLPKAVQYQWIRELITQGHVVYFIRPDNAMRCSITSDGQVEISKKAIFHTDLPAFFVGITSPTLAHAHPEPKHELEVKTPLTTNYKELTPFWSIGPWDRVAYDEAHTLRNGIRLKGETGFGGVTLKYVRAHRILTKPGAPKWGLTGTPLQNRVSDIASLLSWIGIPITHKETMVDDIPGYIRLKMFRRSGDNLRELTKKAIHFPSTAFEDHKVMVVYQSRLESAFYEKAAGEIEKRAELAEMQRFSGMTPTDNTLSLISSLRFLSAHPQMYIDSTNKKYSAGTGTTFIPKWTGTCSKLSMIQDKLKELLSDNESCVVFCHFDEEARQIEICGRKAGYTHVSIMNGKITPEERDYTVQNGRVLVKRGEAVLIIASIMSCGEGLNMQFIRNAIISTPDWNPANENQAIGRLNRIGQTKQVRVWRYYHAELQNASVNIDKYIGDTKDRKELLEQEYVIEIPNAAWDWPAMDIPGQPGVSSTFFMAAPSRASRAGPVPRQKLRKPRKPDDDDDDDT